jgi:hypothetical protein
MNRCSFVLAEMMAALKLMRFLVAAPLICLGSVNAFLQPPNLAPSQQRGPQSSLHAIGVLARKAKEAEIRKYYEARFEDDVMEQYKKIKAFDESSGSDNEQMVPLQPRCRVCDGTSSAVVESTQFLYDYVVILVMITFFRCNRKVQSSPPKYDKAYPPKQVRNMEEIMNQTSTITSSKDQHDSDLTRCLIDLHGTCLVMPFHREGIPYLSLAFFSILQLNYLIQRMMAREINYMADYSNLIEWHLLLGRLGLVFLAFGLLLENIGTFLGSFDISWPSYIVDAPNATIANQLWHLHSYSGASGQTFVWWYHCFLVTALAPLTWFSASYIIFKSIRRRRRLPYSSIWFRSSATLWFSLLIFSVGIFIVLTMGSGVLLSQQTGIWSLSAVSWDSSQVVKYAWLMSLLVVGVILLFQRQLIMGSTILVSDCLAFAMQVLVVKGVYWWPVLSQFVLQLSLLSHLWADAVHTPDDFGPVPRDQQGEARLPLLTPQQQQVARGEEREVTVEETMLDDQESANDETGEDVEEDGRESSAGEDGINSG